MSRPIVLVTNDDGVKAPGIRSLAAALESEWDVWVVAPSAEASASSQSLSLKRPLRSRRFREQVYGVDGTPADCVYLAITELLPERPALVVSGINPGANLAEDVFHSGTVGAAREGACLGVPSVAVSLTMPGAKDFSVAADLSARVAALVLERGLPEGTLLNVNVPAGHPTKVAVTMQGRRAFVDKPQGTPPGAPVAPWFGELESGHRRGDVPSDIDAVLVGAISVTPLHTDTTHHALVSGLRAWEDALSDGDGRRLA